MEPTARSPRRPWLAVLLGLLCNGLGHVYAGRVLLGLGVYAVWLAVATGFAFGLASGPVRAAGALGATVLYWLGQAIHAGSIARRTREVDRHWLSRSLGLLLLYVMATGVNIAARPVLNAFVVQTYVLPTASMVPTLEIGDLIVAAPRGNIERGAVVVHAAQPGSRSRDPLVKRVVAVAGDTVEVRDGRLVLNGSALAGEELPGACTYFAIRQPRGEWLEQPCRARAETLGEVAYRTYCAPDQPCGDYGPERVPEGHVFVLGDHRDASADSRVYGPIPESSILGRVRWIYFSMGPEGMRRERIGLEVR
jgi:signal peptidase I